MLIEGCYTKKKHIRYRLLISGKKIIKANTVEVVIKEFTQLVLIKKKKRSHSRILHRSVGCVCTCIIYIWLVCKHLTVSNGIRPLSLLNSWSINYFRGKRRSGGFREEVTFCQSMVICLFSLNKKRRLSSLGRHVPRFRHVPRQHSSAALRPVDNVFVKDACCFRMYVNYFS